MHSSELTFYEIDVNNKRMFNKSWLIYLAFFIALIISSYSVFSETITIQEPCEDIAFSCVNKYIVGWEHEDCSFDWHNDKHDFLYGSQSCVNDCVNKTCVGPSTIQCTDSDGGLDYITKGTVLSDFWDIRTEHEDFCVNNKLYEYYCDGNIQFLEFHDCIGICQDGRCIDDDQQSCTDSDDGMDKFVKGTITSGVNSATDYCYNQDFVTEFYCEGNVMKSERIFCNKICKDGACTDCRSHDHLKCFQNDLFWYNSCDELEDLEDDCQPYGCVIDECADSPCTDTDNGQDVFVSGQVTYGSLSATDTCDGDKITEMYCPYDGINPISNITYTCPNGCSNGACELGQEPEVIEDSCTDSDNGQNEYVKGTVTEIRNGTEYTSYDTCIELYETPNNRDIGKEVEECDGELCELWEKYCHPVSNDSRSAVVKCSDGCINGTCIEVIGNGTVSEPVENISSAPTIDSCSSDADCDDNNVSTNDICAGITKSCVNMKITLCKNDDGYCPDGCLNPNDNDCESLVPNNETNNISMNISVDIPITIIESNLEEEEIIQDYIDDGYSITNIDVINKDDGYDVIVTISDGNEEKEFIGEANSQGDIISIKDRYNIMFTLVIITVIIIVIIIISLAILKNISSIKTLKRRNKSIH